jgi:hypothetical protein
MEDPRFLFMVLLLNNLGSKLSVRRILSSPPPVTNGTKTEINWLKAVKTNPFFTQNLKIMALHK